MKNLNVLSSVLNSSPFMVEEFSKGTEFVFGTVRCFDNKNISKVSEIKTEDEARATSIAVLNKDTKKRFYITLGNVLGMVIEGSDEDFFSTLKDDDNDFPTGITIESAKVVKEDGKTIYPFRTYKSYATLKATATKEFATALQSNPELAKEFDGGQHYLHSSGLYKDALDKLKGGNANLRFANAKPYHTFTCTVIA